MHKQPELLPDTTPSPFGGLGVRCQTMPVARIVDMYREKCGVDVGPAFGGLTELGLYRCPTTGYRYWRPASVAGDEAFYRTLSAGWKTYYRTDRWEYGRARRYLNDTPSVLEIGCGPGHYLKSIEDQVRDGLGIEFNSEAIANKVTRLPIVRSSVESLAADRPGAFQVAHAFQVLEHVPEPLSFIRSALACLAEGGRLILSTPNHDHEAFRKQEDAFDLPPHHIGHFDAPTYEAIADLLGVRVVEIAVEEGGSRRSSFARSLVDRLRRARPEPGPNMMVVYQK